MDYISLKEKLNELGDPNLEQFQKKIVCTKLKIYGVRTPDMRKLAREISKRDEFLSWPNYETYETALIIALAMAYSTKTLDEKLDFFFDFYKDCDSWAIVDSVAMTMKLKKVPFKEIKPKLLRFIKSKDTFVHRFAIVVLLNYYLDEPNLNTIFKLISDKEDYYIMMAEAWLLATAYTKCPSITYEYLKNAKLSMPLKKKTLQKIKDSYRISDENKQIIAAVLR